MSVGLMLLSMGGLGICVVCAHQYHMCRLILTITDIVVQEADQLKLELQDISKEMNSADDQITALKDKITREEKELERLTQASDAAKVTSC